MQHSAHTQLDAAAERPVSEWRVGWRVLIAALVATGIGTPLFQMTNGLFIVPMQKEFGWSRRALAVGPMVLLMGALLQPFAGAFIDRFGARLAAIVGLLLLCAAYPILALTPANPWIFYGAVALVGLAGPIASGAPSLKGVASWFPKNSGLAFGITLSGVSIASAAALPFLSHLIQKHGWRTGYLTLFAVVACLGLPLVLLWFREQVRAEAKGAGQSSDATRVHPDLVLDEPAGIALREVLRDRRYWVLVVALGGASLPVGGFVSQLQPLLASVGFTPARAASVGTVFAIAVGLSRMGAGKLLDRFNPSIVAATCIVLPALGAFLLTLIANARPVWSLAAVAAFLLGFGQGAEIDFVAYFTLRLFGLRHFSLIFGTIIVAINAALASGGFLFATVFDVLGTYHVALYGAVVIYLCAALTMLTLKVPPRVQRRVI